MNPNDQLSLFGTKASPLLTGNGSVQSAWWEMPFLVIDTETTGLHPKKDTIIEVAWVFCQGGFTISQGAHLIHVEQELSSEVKGLTGISDDMLHHAPLWPDVMPQLKELLHRSTFLVAYNADFDRRFLEHAFEKEGQELERKHWVDPYVFIKDIDKYKKGKKLVDAARRWGVSLNGAHRALADAAATAGLLLKLKETIGIHDLDDLMNKQAKLKEAQERDFQAYLQRKKSSEKESNP